MSLWKVRLNCFFSSGQHIEIDRLLNFHQKREEEKLHIGLSSYRAMAANLKIQTGVGGGGQWWSSQCFHFFFHSLLRHDPNILLRHNPTIAVSVDTTHDDWITQSPINQWPRHPEPPEDNLCISAWITQNDRFQPLWIPSTVAGTAAWQPFQYSVFQWVLHVNYSFEITVFYAL